MAGLGYLSGELPEGSPGDSAVAGGGERNRGTACARGREPAESGHLTRETELHDRLSTVAPGPDAAIVGIASIHGIVASSMNPAYAASKAGVLGLTRTHPREAVLRAATTALTHRLFRYKHLERLTLHAVPAQARLPLISDDPSIRPLTAYTLEQLP